MQPSGSKWRLAWWKNMETPDVFEFFLAESVKKHVCFDDYQASESKILQKCWKKHRNTLWFWVFFAENVKQPCVFRTFFSHRRAECWKTSGFESSFAENVKKTICILTIFWPRILRARSDTWHPWDEGRLHPRVIKMLSKNPLGRAESGNILYYALCIMCYVLCSVYLLMYTYFAHIYVQIRSTSKDIHYIIHNA